MSVAVTRATLQSADDDRTTRSGVNNVIEVNGNSHSPPRKQVFLEVARKRFVLSIIHQSRFLEIVLQAKEDLAEMQRGGGESVIFVNNNVAQSSSVVQALTANFTHINVNQPVLPGYQLGSGEELRPQAMFTIRDVLVLLAAQSSSAVPSFASSWGGTSATQAHSRTSSCYPSELSIAAAAAMVSLLPVAPRMAQNLASLVAIVLGSHLAVRGLAGCGHRGWLSAQCIHAGRRFSEVCQMTVALVTFEDPCLSGLLLAALAFLWYGVGWLSSSLLGPRVSSSVAVFWSLMVLALAPHSPILRLLRMLRAASLNNLQSLSAASGTVE
jgi:hypothetical protein